MSRVEVAKGLVADIGCGTGLIGLHFAKTDFILDGLDISKGMLQIAKKRGAYRDLIQVDLKDVNSYPKEHYAGIISSGTFTLGHLGPEVLLKTLLLADDYSLCVFGINSKHFHAEGFVKLVEKLESDDIIKDVDLINVPIYSVLMHKKNQINIAKLLIFNINKKLGKKKIEDFKF